MHEPLPLFAVLHLATPAGHVGYFREEGSRYIYFRRQGPGRLQVYEIKFVYIREDNIARVYSYKGKTHVLMM